MSAVASGQKALYTSISDRYADFNSVFWTPIVMPNWKPSCADTGLQSRIRIMTGTTNMQWRIYLMVSLINPIENGLYYPSVYWIDGIWECYDPHIVGLAKSEMALMVEGPAMLNNGISLCIGEEPGQTDGTHTPMEPFIRISILFTDLLPGVDFLMAQLHGFW